MTDARAYLESIRDTDSSIQMKTKRMQELHDRLTSITAPLDQERVSHTTNVDVMGNTVALIEDMRKEIDQQMHELFLAKAQANRLFDQLHPENARILTSYYLEHQTTLDIARMMFITRRHAQRRLKEALAELQSILDSG